VQHIKTRDSHAIRSHAQKYFIKLYRDGLPLPAKVAASGSGYTLSGKELDPDSAAARPYLKGFKRPATPGESNGSDTTSSKTESEQTNENGQISRDNLVKEKAKKKTPVKKSRKSTMRPESSSPEPEMVTERTEYAKSRPTRTSAKLLKGEMITFSGNYDDENAHRMVPCEKYTGIPGSGVPGSQPFKIKVNKQAILMMDLHAHLLATEVIGFLAGKWDPKERGRFAWTWMTWQNLPTKFSNPPCVSPRS
jgi:protein MYSM1